jgi:predicted nucleic acid-binding protein
VAPFLTDPNDELVLELAVSAKVEYIVTHNIRDFKGTEKFGIQAKSPKEFLQIIRDVKE